MFDQPRDFGAESDALHAVLAPLGEEELARSTLFKNWTVNDVLTHLHFWNQMADWSLTNEERYTEVATQVLVGLQTGGLRAFENNWFAGLTGHALLNEWRELYRDMAERWVGEDPSRRVKWIGPGMSLRSSITARLMEIWSHGQSIYDLLGVERVNTDRIRNIAHLGVATYGWTFANRKMDPPGPPPHVRLVAPSGAVWEWNEPDPDNSVSGDAGEFCQVVTQTRNIADTSLETTGEVAEKWMEIAQCFAGAVETPPAKGARHLSVG